MIHRYWTGPAPEPTDTAASIDEHHPGSRRDWHDADLPAEIAEWVAARHDQVAAVDIPRHRSNMVRWWLLWHHGGVWLDHDVTLTAPIPEGTWVVSSGGTVCACAVSLPAGHQLAAAMLNRLQVAPPSDKPCPQVSGSRTLELEADRLKVPRLELTAWCDHAWATSTLRRTKEPQ